jgi:phosphoglycolate phosphatase
MKIESIIFDIDGTLWDSRSLVAEGYNSQLQKEGYDHLCVTAEELKPLFGKTMKEIADILFASLPVPFRYELLERCMEAENCHLHSSPCDTLAFPGIREAMEELAKDHRLFIVSNSQQGYPEVCMEKMGIAHLIQGHLCFGDTGTEKGLTILKLMQQHNITDAVYIGDTQGDYEATVVAGIPFVWAAYGFGTPAGFAARIDEASQLPEAVKELKN